MKHFEMQKLTQLSIPHKFTFHSQHSDTGNCAIFIAGCASKCSRILWKDLRNNQRTYLL